MTRFFGSYSRRIFTQNYLGDKRTIGLSKEKNLETQIKQARMMSIRGKQLIGLHNLIHICQGSILPQHVNKSCNKIITYFFQLKKGFTKMWP